MINFILRISGPLWDKKLSIEGSVVPFIDNVRDTICTRGAGLY